MPQESPTGLVATPRSAPAKEPMAQPANERQPLGAPDAKIPSWTRSPTAPTQAAPAASSLAGTVRTVLSLGGVVAIIVGLAYGVKRLSRGSGGLMNQLGAGGRAPSGVLSILGRYPVSRGTTLVLLKADRRVLLLCQTAGKGFTSGCSMQTLTEFTDPEDVASILLKTRDEEEASLAQRFEAMLSREDETAARTLNAPLGPRKARAASVAPSPIAAPVAAPAPASTRAARAAARQPDAVLRPSPVPSDPRAQLSRAQPDRTVARVEAPSRTAPNGPMLRGVVA